jgi:Uma2 family endonuclease
VRPFTKHDYWELPDAGPRYQLIEGELFMAPAPDRFHQDCSRNIQFAILKYLETNPIGVLYDAPFDVVLSDLNVFQPDLAFISESRRHVLTRRGAEGPPDLVVEILSPSTARLDVESKRLVYARAGVQELWIVDPETFDVRIYRFSESADLPPAVLRRPASITSSLLPGFVLSLDDALRSY